MEKAQKKKIKSSGIELKESRDLIPDFIDVK
jgi:hypothetical protein